MSAAPRLGFDKPSGRTGKRILIVGAGPSGLSAAYHSRAPGTTSSSATPARTRAA